MTRKELLNAETIATWYGGFWFYGAEIKAVDDEKIYLLERCSETVKPHVLKLHQTLSGDYYFVLNGRRVPLNECIRV